MLPGKRVRYLKDHGTQQVVAWVQRENQAMRVLATRSGFKVDAATSDSTTLRYVLELGAAACPRAHSAGLGAACARRRPGGAAALACGSVRENAIAPHHGSAGFHLAGLRAQAF